MEFADIFPDKKPIIGCIHLLPLPGAPKYAGRMAEVFETALSEVEIYRRHHIDGLIIENFRDRPFYPGQLPHETVASLAAVAREVKRAVNIPIGINALRNDGAAAIAVATAVEAEFVRVNVHMGAVVSEQGLIQGLSHETLRLRAALRSEVLIFADVGVKHAAPLAHRGLATETKDLVDRGMVDAIIVSGELTGAETNPEDVQVVRQVTDLPILIGSGATPDNLHRVYPLVDGFIVGSYFKKDGCGANLVDEVRVRAFADRAKAIAHGG